LGLLEFLVLDRLDDRLRLLLRDALRELDLAAHRVVCGGRDRPELEVLHRDAAFDEFPLQHVEQRLHFEVVVRDERERRRGAIERDGGLRTLEVVALGDLLGRLIHGVIDLLQVGAGRDVEGREGAHGGGI
jgi:hypothetical protein